MAVEFYPFGRLSDGRQVTAAKLKNRAGASVTVLDYGATIQSLCVPARDGSLVDVVLGYDTAEEYEPNGDFFGATIGRVANRIGGAAFELHGKRYELAKNDGENHLHGGTEGFDRKLWRMAAQGESLLCWRISPDGEENYPGNLKVQVLFTLTEDNRLCIGYDIGADIGAEEEQLKLAGGYDHNFVLAGKKAAVVCGDQTGIELTVETDLPGIQLYTANMLSERVGKGGRTIGRREAFCLETQLYPNAMNCWGFPSPVLHAGEHMHSETVYAFRVR